MYSMKNVLIIDDEQDTLFLMNLVLTKSGFQVHTLSSGENAVKTAERLQPDAIVLDIKLDDHYDGRDICKKLKANPLTNKTKIILNSGNITADEVACGFCEDAFMSKPIKSADLINKLNHLMKS